MSKYNIHKRRTLDRLSHKHQLILREALRRHAEKQIDQIYHALDQGRKTFVPGTDGLEKIVYKIFADHLFDVVRVGISDGIQEVTPDKKLNLWEKFPVDMPVENTLSVDLAERRDEWVDIFFKRRRRLVEQLTKFVTSTLNEHVRSIRKAYSRSAHDWLNWESEDQRVSDVQRKLKEALVTTDYRSAMVFRTETTAYFNQARHDYFAENTAVDYMQLFAVTDGRISEICESRHKFVVSIDKAGLRKYMPPFHPHCRTIQRPLISALPRHKAMIDEGLKMNESGFVKLPRGWAA